MAEKSSTPVAEAPEATVPEAQAQTFESALNAGEPTEDLYTGPAETEEYQTVSAAVAVLTAEPEFDRDEISLPRLRCAQGLTPEVQSGEAKPGQWVLLGSEAVDRVIFIPLLFGRDYNHRDADGRIVLNCTDPNCPDREWTEDPKTGKRAGPKCVRVYRYMGWSVTHQSLVELHLQKTAEEAAKHINTFIATKKLGNFAVELGSKTKSGPRGNFFTPAVRAATVEPGDFAEARAALPSA